MCDCLERAITKGRGSQHLLCCKMRKSIRHYGWLGVLTQVLSLSFSLSNTHTHTHIQTHTHSFLSISGNSFTLRRAVKRAPRKKRSFMCNQYLNQWESKGAQLASFKHEHAQWESCHGFLLLWLHVSWRTLHERLKWVMRKVLLL